MEKQIIAGALALVAVFLTVVVFKGVQSPTTDPLSKTGSAFSDYPDPDATGTQMVPAAELDSGTYQPVDAAGTMKFQPSDERLFPQPPDTSGTGTTPQFEPFGGTPYQDPYIAGELDYDEELIDYTVQRGDTLSEIAQRMLGSTRYLDDILAVNETLDEDRLFEGQVISLPRKESLVTTGKRERTSPALSMSAQPEKSSRTAVRTHTVIENDTLWKISTRYYKNGAGVDKIVRANDKLKNRGTVLLIGMTLVIPE